VNAEIGIGQLMEVDNRLPLSVQNDRAAQPQHALGDDAVGGLVGMHDGHQRETRQRS
jgi:hypothetical protein